MPEGCSRWKVPWASTLQLLDDSPQCLPFLICEMGAGKGWKPRSGGALDKGSKEKEAEVRAWACCGGPEVKRLGLWDACDKSQQFVQNSQSKPATLESPGPFLQRARVGWLRETEPQNRTVTSQGHSEHCGNMGRLKSKPPRGSMLPDLADDYSYQKNSARVSTVNRSLPLHPDSQWWPLARTLTSRFHPLRGKEKGCPPAARAAHFQDGLRSWASGGPARMTYVPAPCPQACQHEPTPFSP